MKTKHFISLIFSLFIFSFCSDVNENLDFQEADKTKLVLDENIFTDNYFESVEIKNPNYSKIFETKSEQLIYEYESEHWKDGEIYGGFIASTFIHPKSDSNNMNRIFSAFLAGQKLEATFSSGLEYKRTYDLKLPYENYQIYQLVSDDAVNKGLVINLLKENKIIFSAFILNGQYELELDKFIEKLSEI